MKRIACTFVALSLLYPTIAFLSGGQFAIGSFLAVASFTVPASLFLGFPAFLLFMRNGWLSWQHLAIAGAAIGFICSLPFVVGGVSMFVQFSLVFFGIGGAHGLLFWLFGVWRNNGLTHHSSGTPNGAP